MVSHLTSAFKHKKDLVYEGGKQMLVIQPRIHIGRTAGGDRYHRRSRGALAAGDPGCPRSCAEVAMLQQSKTAITWSVELRVHVEDYPIQPSKRLSRLDARLG